MNRYEKNPRLAPKKRVQAVPAALPEEVVGRLVDFIARKFYPGAARAFGMDRGRLVSWVVLFPARWLHERGVSLPARRYEEILTRVLMGALEHAEPGRIKYLPAWLREAVESHFAHHGDEYYEEGKSLRNVAASVLAGVACMPVKERDIVGELVKMERLLKATKGKAKPSPIVGKQRELF